MDLTNKHIADCDKRARALVQSIYDNRVDAAFGSEPLRGNFDSGQTYLGNVGAIEFHKCVNELKAQQVTVAAPAAGCSLEIKAEKIQLNDDGNTAQALGNLEVKTVCPASKPVEKAIR